MNIMILKREREREREREIEGISHSVFKLDLKSM